jgi:choloylglycine hydrolase
LHFLVVDATGQGIVVEPTKNRIMVHNNLVHVITNSPSFDRQLNNLHQYIKLINVDRGPVMPGQNKLEPSGPGSGMLGLPGDITPQALSRLFLQHFLKSE